MKQCKQDDSSSTLTLFCCFQICSAPVNWWRHLSEVNRTVTSRLASWDLRLKTLLTSKKLYFYVNASWATWSVRSLVLFYFRSQEWSTSIFSFSMSPEIIPYSMENLVIDSLLRWKLIEKLFLITSLNHFLLEWLGEFALWAWDWKD